LAYFPRFRRSFTDARTYRLLRVAFSKSIRRRDPFNPQPAFPKLPKWRQRSFQTAPNAPPRRGKSLQAEGSEVEFRKLKLTPIAKLTERPARVVGGVIENRLAWQPSVRRQVVALAVFIVICFAAAALGAAATAAHAWAYSPPSRRPHVLPPCVQKTKTNL
jgi:hypothetical protein